MRNPISFLVQTVVNPNSGEETQRLAVKYDTTEVVKLYIGEQTLEDTIKSIKADKAVALKRVVYREGEFGPYAVLTHAVTTEEI